MCGSSWTEQYKKYLQNNFKFTLVYSELKLDKNFPNNLEKIRQLNYIICQFAFHLRFFMNEISSLRINLKELGKKYFKLKPIQEGDTCVHCTYINIMKNYILCEYRFVNQN